MLTFNAEAAAGKREPAVPPKIAAARNAAIAAVIAATGGTTERLSPDVEGPARRLGRAIGDRVLAFAKEQGWLEKTEALEPAAVQALPPKKPEKKSDNRPDQPDDEPGQPKT